ncbi:hypothetical protein FACS1894162_5270 [Bacteroidia bacterium]|nr:hypothetical protein FACS1894162_5270 [Bacteroidia bacterium]
MKMKKKVILMTLLLIGAVSVNAQVRIGGTAAADKAILDLNASNTATNATQGLALPRAAALPAVAPTIDGVLIYSAGDVYVSKAGVWEKLGSGTGGDSGDGGGTGDGGETPPPPPPAWTCGDSLLVVGSNSYTTALLNDGSCWMTENLRETKYSDGTDLVQDNTGYQYPNKDQANVATQGLLYTWAAATNNENASTDNQAGATHDAIQGICPDGWHLPSDLEIATSITTTLPDEFTVANYPGIAAGTTASNVGTHLYLWTSSSNALTKSWCYFTKAATPTVIAAYAGARTNQYSVRCKKN